MKYVVYLDVVWLENTILDILFLGFLVKCRKGCVKKWGRVIAGGIAGGFCAIAVYFVPILQKHLVMYELCSSAIVILIAVPHAEKGCKRVKSICLEMCMLHAILFVYAGLWQWCKEQKLQSVHSFIVLLLLACVVGGGIHIGLSYIRRRQSIICKVKLYYASRMVEMNALVDTGNSLREPVTGKPVSVVEMGALGDILHHDTLHRDAVQEDILKTKVCVIPYHAIGKRGILYGIKIPRMEIVKDGEITLHENAVVAIYKGKLAGNKGYQMILHPDMLAK